MIGAPNLTVYHPVEMSDYPTDRSFPITQYFSIDEISQLLEHSAFVGSQEVNIPKDKWSKVNNFRSLVPSALNAALFEIISSNAKDEHPIVEIGSGIGYALPESLSHKTIRIQPSPAECQLLSRTISDPIYQMNMEDLYHSLVEHGKKISLFFALDVFDTMSPVERKTNVSRISQLQNAGDRILMLLDSNPCLEVIIEELETLHPNHAALPYFPLTTDCSKFSLIMIPLERIGFNPAEIDLVQIIQRETLALMNGYVSGMQMQLHQLQKDLDLKVIAIEDFFVEQMKIELEQIGYKTNIYYHASFTTGDLPDEDLKVKQDLIYKSVTDTSTIRQWSLTDKNLVSWLSQKGLILPGRFDEAFLSDLREKGQKIFGAEILVIEATKM